MLTALTQADAGPVTLLEVGAGAGNTLFPILARNQNPQLRMHACDFSAKAIDLIRADARFDEAVIQTHVWDVSSPDPSPSSSSLLPPPSSVDVILLIFTFSALAPDQWRPALYNLHRLLKPTTGRILFRDYARGDLAQVRFKSRRYLDENFYVRGDGTRVYFFDPDELRTLWTMTSTSTTTHDDEEAKEKKKEGPLFNVIQLDVDRRLLVNRQRKLKMFRSWIQASFSKRGEEAEEEEEEEAKADGDGEGEGEGREG